MNKISMISTPLSIDTRLRDTEVILEGDIMVLSLPAHFGEGFFQESIYSLGYYDVIGGIFQNMIF